MSSVEVDLGLSLNIRGICAAREALLEAFSAAEQVVVVVRPEADMDLLLIQMLESARGYAAAAGKRLTLTGPAGTELRGLLARAGFAGAMTPERAAFWGLQGQGQ